MAGQLEETIQLIEQVQELDAQQVARNETLGSAFELTGAVPMMSKSIDLLRKIPAAALQDLGESQRNQIKTSCEQILAIFGRLMSFNPADLPNAAQERQSLIDESANIYNSIFSTIYPIVAYLTARLIDPSEATRMAQRALADLQQISERGTAIIATVESEASRVLNEVRRTAAESGVSQQAIYFGDEAAAQNLLSGKWQTYTNWTAMGLGAFALASLALSLYWSPENPYQTAQIALSKVLIFSTIAFMLFLSSRTLMAHRHNEVVNKHRQNALLTFNALVEASGDQQTREVVLTHASACIFAPQETGFSKQTSNPSPSSLLEVLPRAFAQQSHQG